MVFFSKYSLAFFLFSIGNLISVSGQIKLPTSKHQFVVIAHRGDHTELPENTLESYKRAIKHRVDYVEIDLRTTKDSQLVIMHDESLLRMTGINAKVSSLTYDSISNLIVRDASHPEWGEYKVPSFREVLQLCKGKINIYLDFKNASVSQAYREIIEEKMQDHFIVYINSPKQFKEWREVAPSVPLMVSLPNKIKTAEELTAFLNNTKPDILDGNYSDYNEAMIFTANKMGIPVWPDIQSAQEEKNWETAVKLKFEGLQTDHPKMLVDFLKKKGLR
jgi:glycerophosphoryl diester phosphodiesterase